MGRTVGELLDSISYPELLEWGEFYGVEPFGEWRADVRTAQIAQTIANVNRDPKSRPEPYQIADFLLFERKPEPVEPEEYQGAHIAPETLTWLFSMSLKNVH